MNNQPAPKSYSAFLPLVLIALGVILLFSWNLSIALNQQTAGVRISAQQDLQLAQAAQTELKLKTMMTDLLELSKTDKEAEAIIKRYKIAINKDK
ncbi:MAG: hypothetical protein WCI95_09835 [bacterium]